MALDSACEICTMTYVYLSIVPLGTQEVETIKSGFIVSKIPVGHWE